MNNKIKAILTGSILMVLLFIFFFPERMIKLEAEGYDARYLPDETFELHWIHSIEKSEWYEIYEVEADAFLLTDTYFETFGAGVPHESESAPELTEDGFVKFTVNDTYKTLYLNVSENVETTIIQNQKEYPLYEFYEANTALEMKFVNTSLIQRITGG
ncbi:DUF1850 domain-containing protein [Salinicoccus bachuensis]|uniref:DUF1850 domain-containing protein n=1 Tax=Salinicoccus bachuensis TaxID=3136731 RepID=A0ABZ3CI93_9STAP